jgi:hypothetical protein
MNGRNLSIVLVSVICAGVLAACGGSGASGTGGADPLLNLARCMRAHGVSNFPDPSRGHGLTIGPGINPQSPAFQAAQQACKRFAGPVGGAPKMSESERRQAVRFAECMRANGQPNFPDPTLIPPAHATRVLVLRGMVFAFGSGIDPKSAAFRQAATKCGLTPPG